MSGPPPKFAFVTAEPTYDGVGGGIATVLQSKSVMKAFNWLTLLWNMLNTLTLPIIWFLCVNDVIQGPSDYNTVVASFQNPLSMHAYIMNPIIMFMFIFIFIDAGVSILYRLLWNGHLGSSHFVNNPLVGFCYAGMWISFICIAESWVWPALAVQCVSLVLALINYWAFPVKYMIAHIGKSPKDKTLGWYAPMHLTTVLEYLTDKLAWVSIIMYTGLNVCGLFIGGLIVTNTTWPLNLDEYYLSITFLTIFTFMVLMLHALWYMDTFFTMLAGFDFLFLCSYMVSNPVTPMFLTATTGAYGGFLVLLSMYVGYKSLKNLSDYLNAGKTQIYILPNKA